MRTWRALRLAASLLPLAACGGAPAADVDADITSYNCAADPRPQQYSVGLEAKGAAGRVDFKLVSAAPAPPARGDNTWVVQLAAMSNDVVGAPIPGATLTVSPFMPDHQHGTPISVEITDQGGGMYQLAPVNLWMPGYWETTIKVASSAGSDSAVYKFCLSE